MLFEDRLLSFTKKKSYDIIHCNHPLSQIVSSFAEINQRENLRQTPLRKRRGFSRVDFSLKSSIYR